MLQAGYGVMVTGLVRGADRGAANFENFGEEKQIGEKRTKMN